MQELNETVERIDRRLEKLEHIMYGNGEQGALDTMREIRKDVGRLSEDMNREIGYVKVQVDKIKPRVDSLDKLAWKLAGGFSAIVVAVQIIATIIKVVNT